MAGLKDHGVGTPIAGASSQGGDDGAKEGGRGTRSDGGANAGAPIERATPVIAGINGGTRLANVANGKGLGENNNRV